MQYKSLNGFKEDCTSQENKRTSNFLPVESESKEVELTVIGTRNRGPAITRSPPAVLGNTLDQGIKYKVEKPVQAPVKTYYIRKGKSLDL